MSKNSSKQMITQVQEWLISMGIQKKERPRKFTKNRNNRGKR